MLKTIYSKIDSFFHIPAVAFLCVVYFAAMASSEFIHGNTVHAWFCVSVLVLDFINFVMFNKGKQV